MKLSCKRIVDDITDFIFVRDDIRKSDALFIPGAAHPELGETAAVLWRDGWAQWVLPSGGVSVKSGKFAGPKSKADIYTGDYRTDCEFLTDVLIRNGVDAQAIVGEDKSGYTKENAYLTRAAADARVLAIRRAILVCKTFHARRALMCYQLAFPETEILVHPVECYGITRDNWHTFDYGIERVLGELMRCGNQFNGEFLSLSRQDMV